MKKIAVVLAGGRGSRMNSDIPKQYLMLKDRPVLYYALKAFQDSDIDSIVLAAMIWKCAAHRLLKNMA
jgi:2-C-methyl-D-erythritol 4-phosphate cytidylyltransferase